MHDPNIRPKLHRVHCPVGIAASCKGSLEDAGTQPFHGFGNIGLLAFGGDSEGIQNFHPCPFGELLKVPPRRRSGRFIAFDMNPVGALAGLGEVVGRLQT